MPPETDPTPTELELPVEAPEPDESTELVEALTPRLGKDEERVLADLILADYQGAITDRSEWEARLAEWDDQYYGRTQTVKTFPWVGSANFHVPITMMGVETLKPRLVEAVMGQTPPLIVVPTEGTDEDRRERVETFLNWQVAAELDLGPTVTQSAHLFLHPGLALVKTYWKVQRIRRKLVREFPLDTPLETVLRDLFGVLVPTDLEKTKEGTWEGTLPASPGGGDPLEVILKLKVLDDALQVLLDKEELIEQPHSDLIDPVDFFAPARGGHEIADLPWCQHRLWYTENDLRLKAAQGRFYVDTVRELLRSHTPTGDAGEMDATAYKASQAEAEGVESEGESDARTLQYAILEDYRRYDIDEDGFEEEIIVWVAPDLPQKVLGWDYLDNVYAHGRRPIRAGRYFPIPFRFYGLAFAEVVKGIQDEINTIHNQRVDYGTITNLPFYFYRSSSQNPPIQQQLVPGQGVPISDPQNDILFPKWASSPAWGQSEEMILHQYFERLTGLTDLTLGRQPNRVGATRTAAGTQTLLSEAGLRFKTAMIAFQQLWIGVFEDILALDQEYLPPGKEFRVTGKRPEFIRLADRTEIRGRYDIRLAATTETLNRQQMREDASRMLQVILHPALIQSRVIGLKGVTRGLADYFKAFGRDPDHYLEPASVVLSPEEELARFASGVYVPPSPNENVQQHLTAHQAQLMDPDLARYMSPQVRQKLQRHIQDTLRLVQAQQLAQGLQGPQAGIMPPEQDGNVQVGQAAPQPMQGAQGPLPGAIA